MATQNKVNNILLHLCTTKVLLHKLKTKYIFLFVKPVHIFKTTTKKINTVHNLVTFSIIFTNKNGGGGRFNPPPS